MRLYLVTIYYTLRGASTATSNNLVIRRYANSASSAIATVSALFGSLSNFSWDTGDNAGLRSLEVDEVTASEITN